MTPSIEKIIKEWEDDPQSMFTWRSRKLKEIMLMLDRIMLEESDRRSRSQGQTKIRAADMITRIFERMGAMRVDVPVVCPHCGEEHVVP